MITLGSRVTYYGNDDALNDKEGVVVNIDLDPNDPDTVEILFDHLAGPAILVSIDELEEN